MIDVQNETSIPVNDQVSGFTNAQLFNSIQSDVKSVQQYKLRFQQQNPNNQTIQITNLFSQYGY